MTDFSNDVTHTESVVSGFLETQRIEEDDCHLSARASLAQLLCCKRRIIPVLRDFPESDWKVLSKLKPVVLDRFCQRVLTEVAQLTAEPGKSEHERYLAVYKLIQRRDRELADAFNGLRRSTALIQLTHIHAHKLLTDEEFSRFSSETQKRIETILRIHQGEPTDDDAETPG